MAAEVRWLNGEEQRAWRSLVVMQQGVSEFLERQLRTRSGLSGADFEVLAHLSEAPEARLRSFELTRLLHWEKSRLSQHLSRMQSRGLVSRSPCREDQRGTVVTITPQGRERIEAAAPRHAADVRAVMIDHLSAPELATLSAIGDKVRARLAALAQDS